MITLDKSYYKYNTKILSAMSEDELHKLQNNTFRFNKTMRCKIGDTHSDLLLECISVELFDRRQNKVGKT